MADAPQAGLFESLKAMAASGAGIVQTRLALLSVDIAEERAHLTAIFLWIQTALFCVGVGVLLLTLLLVVAFWDTYRLAVLGGLTALFLTAGAAAAGIALRRSRNRPRLFEASLAELSRDRHELGSGP